jgi:hypothetical protein
MQKNGRESQWDATFLFSKSQSEAIFQLDPINRI